MCDKLIFSAASGPQATPIIHLNKATQEFLDELMMEGDLLEVSLDETVYLWKILNAAKHRVNELEVIKAKYNIPVSSFTAILRQFSLANFLESYRTNHQRASTTKRTTRNAKVTRRTVNRPRSISKRSKQSRKKRKRRR